MATPATTAPGGLDAETRLQILDWMLESRMGDLREQNLLRQGHGWFHVGGIGHEALAALALQLEEGDYLAPYYRDRALVLARGLSTREVALSFFAKRSSSSGGRQLPGHFSSRRLNIWSHPSPIGSHLLPACGIAWGLRLDSRPQVVVASTGEASSRQGDFFEAALVALEKKLPVVFVVEDNGIAISTLNRDSNALAFGFLDEERWVRADGSSVEEVYAAGERAIAHARSGEGPAFLWFDVERGTSHSSADDHRLYRSAAALAHTEEKDPLTLWKDRLRADGLLDEEGFAAREQETRERVRQIYADARREDDPEASEVTLHREDPAPPVAEPPPVQLGEKARLLDAINLSFREVLGRNPDSLFYGQDIADPKGGVFRLTAELSTRDPERAMNAPVAESTILGLACGLASYGKKPFFEIQFIDFIGPGWNQLANNLANLRWRSFGDWSCPAVIYAPYGAYLPGGAIWHSSSSDGLFANLPGLTVAVPSNPEDAAGLIWSAHQATDPVLLLLPKHLLWEERKIPADLPAVPLGRARVRRTGYILTVVTWGNCVELVEEAIEQLGDDRPVELIDLRTVTPWDEATVLDSVRKTGRLLVVQEDTAPGSIGEEVVARTISTPDIWQRLQAPPRTISRQNAPIGYHPTYEYTALPSAEEILGAIRQQIQAVRPAGMAAESLAQAPAPSPLTTGETTTPATPASAPPGPSRSTITVPVLGEGITRARLLNLFKQPGDRFEPDEALCEVETDKAVFPIEAPESGRLEEWKFESGDEVGVGEVLAECSYESAASESTGAPEDSGLPAAPPLSNFRQYESDNGEIANTTGLSAEVIQQMQGLVPATIMVKAKWARLRKARDAIRAAGTMKSPSPSAILAWCLVQAMKKHRGFTHTLLMGKLPRAIGDFDLGIAVSLSGDRLATAILPDANRKDWYEFCEAFRKAVSDTRNGRFQPKTRVPVSLSTMGRYDVQSANPIVVPPSIATLFVGSAHYEPDPDKEGREPREVVRLVLTFDHRWINGAGSASFLTEVKRNIENFSPPE